MSSLIKQTMCQNCSCENLAICLDTKCPFHDTFVTKQMITKIKTAFDALSRYKKPNKKMIDKWCEEDNYAFNLYVTLDSIYEQLHPMLDLDIETVTTENPMLDKCYHSWGETLSEECSKCGAIRSGLFLDVEWSELPDYGDLMTLSDFESACESGAFIDYDGSGNYALEDKRSQISIYPSDVIKNRVDKRFTHVVWFNR